MNATSASAETHADALLGFTIPARHARGRLVRLESVLEEVLAAHAYPAPITHLLGEALVLAALMGGLLKGERAQMTMQAQTEGGIVRLLVCDYRAGAVRGYCDFDAERLAGLGANPTLAALFGEGYLAITFEPEGGRRYQGIVPLEGDSLAAACQNYFSQSEQVPTLIRVASRAGATGRIAGGLLIQHLPDGEEGRERLHVRMDHPDWEHVALLAGTISHEELLDPALSLEAIAWRLFHEEAEVRTYAAVPLSRGCRCSSAHYAAIIARFPPEEQAAMRNEEGIIAVDCAFCSRSFALAI
ncbi:MAG: Hsp33 family molecular chaperone HslO [Erythrobacter cryptus]